MYEGTGAGGSTITVNTPCDARLARFYMETSGTYVAQTLDTDYTVADGGSGKYVATFTDGSPAAGTDLYAYWDTYPQLKVAAGDFVESDESYHRVTGTSGANATPGGITLDHYLVSGIDTIDTHFPSMQIPDGEGEVKIGANILVDGFKLRLIVIPEYNSSAAPSIVKITGIVLGHIPMGRKILQATGE